MASPKVYIVTPVFNTVDHTLSFLKSIQKSDYPNLHIIIADDGSTDGTSQKIRAEYPKTIVLKGTGNLWWSGATNLGVEYAIAHGGDYIYTVNNDVELEVNTISTLVRVAQQNPNTLVGNTIYDIENKKNIWYYGGIFNRKKGILEHKDGENLKLKNKTYTTEWATGMGLLIPKEAYDKAGQYDINYFPQYMGDADFSQRAKKAGFKLLVSSQAKLYSDTKSAWIDKKNFKSKPWKFIYEVFFSIRSPYWLRMRRRFYKLYWGKGWRKALFKANKLVVMGIIGPFILVKLGIRKEKA